MDSFSSLQDLILWHQLEAEVNQAKAEAHRNFPQWASQMEMFERKVAMHISAIRLLTATLEQIKQ